MVDSGANVTHSYLEESGGVVTGGIVTGGVETPSEEEKKMKNQRETLQPRDKKNYVMHISNLLMFMLLEKMVNMNMKQPVALCVDGNGMSRVVISTS